MAFAENCNSGCTRLQIGMSTPGAIPDVALDTFFDSTWINLGDVPPADSASNLAEQPKSMGLRAQLKRLLRRLNSSYDRRCRSEEEQFGARRRWIQKLERSPFFCGFWWSVDGRLDFTDNTFSFIYSEHFLEHIWQDEAYALFAECFRVLKPSGVFRIVVPDADLRVYEAPEPIAFDTKTNLPSTRGWQHPEVHKTRWNVYLLSLLLTQAGFQVVPIAYCSKEGEYVQKWPQVGGIEYTKDADWAVIRESSYIIRKNNSLIVDAIKLV